MRVRLLSRPEVSNRSGRRVSLSATEWRVFAYLLLSLVDADSVPAGSLATALWPNERAIDRLHAHMSNLRGKLPGDIPRDTNRTHQYTTAIPRHEVDVWVFNDLLQRGVPDAVEEAFELWPNPEALEEFSENAKASELMHRRAEAQEEWISTLLGLERGEDAIRHLRQLLTVKPEREGLWATLVLAEKEVHDVSTALAVLAEAKRIVRTEVDASPADLIALERQLRGLPGLPAPPPPEGPVPRAASPHVERTKFLRALVNRLEHGVIAVVHGAPGNGKSTIAAEAAEKFSVDKWWWTFRPGVSDSLDDFVSGLARFLSRQGDDTLSALLTTEASATPPIAIESKAAVAADALSAQDVIVCLDDVPGSEERPVLASFLGDLLESVDRPDTKARIILIGRKLTNIVDVQIPGTLYGLSKRQTRTLLARYGINLPPPLFDRLHEWLRGNVKVLRMFAEWVTAADPEPHEIRRVLEEPETWDHVRNYVMEHYVAPLDAAASRIGLCMALLRKPISWVGLWAIASELAEDPRPPVDALTKSHYVEQVVDGSGYFYLHSLLRDFLRATGTQSEKTKLHAVAARVQEQIGAPVEHLYHLAASGDLPAAAERLCRSYRGLIHQGEALALASLVASWDLGPLDRRTLYDLNLAHAELLRVGGDLKRAIKLYDAAAAVADTAGTRFACKLEKASCYHVLARRQDGLETLNLLLNDPRFPSSGTLRGRAEAARGSLLSQIGDPRARNVMSDGIGTLRAALPDSQAEEALCSALADLGWFELTTGDLTAAGIALTEAHDRQRHLNDDRGRCTTLAWIGRLHWQAGRWAEAEEALNESLELAKHLGDRLKVATARRHLGLLEWNRGNYAEAQALHEDALEAYQRVGDKYGEAATLLNIAAVHFDEGNYAGAKALVDKANALCLEIHAPDFHSYGLLYDGKIAIREGRFDRGLDLTHAAIEKLEEGNYSAFYIGMSKRAAGEALLGLERLDEAQVALEQARAIYEQLGSRVQYAKCLHWLGCLDERRGLGGNNRWREALEIFEAMGAAADARRTLQVLEEGGYG